MVLFTVLPDRPAPGYWIATESGQPIGWTSISPASIWNNSTQTLFWSFNPIGFPQTGWPTVAQAGAAFQNAFQSIQDVGGTNLKFIRNVNSGGVPASGDGLLETCLTPNAMSDYFGQNIGNEIAVTYVTFDTATGSLLDADMEVNGAVGHYPDWSTAGPGAPPGFLDLESIAIRQIMTALGTSPTPFFAAATWPTLRSPADPLHDRCLSTDDRMFARTIAPAAPAFTTVTGAVTMASSPGIGCNLAIVVATDANGVPQAETVTKSDGTYTLNIPSQTDDPTPLTAYVVTACHFLNGTYVVPPAPPSVNYLSFTSLTNVPTNFIGVASTTPVNTRLPTSGINLTVTAGTPTLTLLGLSVFPAAVANQVLFLAPGSGGGTASLVFSFESTGTFTSLSNLSLGPGITLGAPSFSTSGSLTQVTATYSVDLAAHAGLRNLSFTTPSGEQFFLPAVVEVVGAGSLNVQPGLQNPGASNAINSETEVPLLQVTLTASAVEDLRIRQLVFSLSGSGAVPTAVHLYNDIGSVPGFFDAGDIPLYTGTAYSNIPFGETIAPSGASATVTYDNLALTLPAGGSITLLLTADMPAAGSGSYTATFDPTVPGNIIVQGMFWGDQLSSSANTVIGGAVSGGVLTLGLVSITGLGQFHTSDNSVIPVGGLTTDIQVSIQGAVTSPTGQVGMEVEAKPVTALFDGTSTQVLAATAASGSVLSLNFTGLVSGTAYHWRARGLSSTGLSSGWVSFGNNPETSADFTVDQSIVSAPSPSTLGQVAFFTGALVPDGGSAQSGVTLFAQEGTDSLGYVVRLEFEVRPSGVPFQNIATSVLQFDSGGNQKSLAFGGTSGAYHWQVRTVSLFGASSTWTPLSASFDNFSLTPPPTSGSKGGCIATVLTSTGVGERIAWLVLAAGIVFLLPVRWRRTGGALGALLLAGALARADQEVPLPRSLLDIPSERGRGSSDLEAPAEPLLSPAMLAQDNPAPPESRWSLDAYAGAIFVDTRFSALGTDRVERQIRGIGAPLVGIEALYNLNDNWRIGLGGQGSLWRDVRMLSGGPVFTWRFTHSKDVAASGRFRWEHFLRAQVAYESFADTKSGFGSFSGTVGAVLGYEFRLTLVRHYSLTIGADVQYAQWNYSPKVLSGDTSIGGLGGFFYVGIAFQP